MVSVNNINNINQYHIPALDFFRMLKITFFRFLKTRLRFDIILQLSCVFFFGRIQRRSKWETCDLAELHPIKKRTKRHSFEVLLTTFDGLLQPKNKNHWSLVDNVRVNDPIFFLAIVWFIGLPV